MIFNDRQDAGKKLALLLKEYRDDPQAVVVGLPRGGVPTAHEVAEELGLPLEVLIARKIGAPGSPEFAVGAVSEDGQRILSSEVIDSLRITRSYINEETERQRREAARRRRLYRGRRAALRLKNKTVILIDDGIATGATMLAAIKSARHRGAGKVIVATPVIAPDTLVRIRRAADRTVYLEAPPFFSAVGQFYKNFSQTSDEEVVKLLNEHQPSARGNS